MYRSVGISSVGDAARRSDIIYVMEKRIRLASLAGMLDARLGYPRSPVGDVELDAAYHASYSQEQQSSLVKLPEHIYERPQARRK